MNLKPKKERKKRQLNTENRLHRKVQFEKISVGIKEIRTYFLEWNFIFPENCQVPKIPSEVMVRLSPKLKPDYKWGQIPPMFETEKLQLLMLSDKLYTIFMSRHYMFICWLPQKKFWKTMSAFFPPVHLISILNTIWKLLLSRFEYFHVNFW